MSRKTAYFIYTRQNTSFSASVQILGLQIVTTEQYPWDATTVNQHLGALPPGSLTTLGFHTTGASNRYTLGYKVRNMDAISDMAVEVMCSQANVLFADGVIKAVFNNLAAGEGQYLYPVPGPIWRSGMPASDWPPLPSLYRPLGGPVVGPKGGAKGSKSSGDDWLGCLGIACIGLILLFAFGRCARTDEMQPAPAPAASIVFPTPIPITPIVPAAPALLPCADGCKFEPADCPSTPVKAFVPPDGMNNRLYVSADDLRYDRVPFNPATQPEDFWFCTTQQAEAKRYKYIGPLR